MKMNLCQKLKERDGYFINESEAIKTIDKEDYNRCFKIFKKDINNLQLQYNVDVSRWKT